MTTNAALRIAPMNAQFVLSKDLAKLLRRALLCACTDAARTNLCQVRFEPANVWSAPDDRGILHETTGAQLVSTDGHRMSVVKTDLLVWDHDTNISRRALEMVLLLCKENEKIVIEHDADGVVFSCDGPVSVRVRSVDAPTFPTWQQVIPSSRRLNTLVGGAGALLKKVRATPPRIRPGPDGDAEFTEAICMGPDADGDLEIVSDNAADHTFVNKGYLVEALRVFGGRDEVCIGTVGGQLDPIVVETAGGAGTKVVVMPIRP
jgi:DNA polymerase III sliding clamp (beta) subunit (PCNA family)